jgi:hypothetical protein
MCSEGLPVVTPCTVTLFSDHMTMYCYTIFRLHDRFPCCYTIFPTLLPCMLLHSFTTNWSIYMLLHLIPPFRPKYLLIHLLLLFLLAIFYAASPTLFSIFVISTYDSIVVLSKFLPFFKNTLCSLCSNKSCFIIT